MTDAMVRGEPVTVYNPASPAAQALTAAWKLIAARLLKGIAFMDNEKIDLHEATAGREMTGLEGWSSF